MTQSTRLNCATARDHIAAGAGDARLAAHLAGCRGCREYTELRAWSERVVRAGEVAVAAPPMAAIWTAIRRNSESAWERTLAGSFRRLVPYLAGVTVILLLAGSLAVRAPQATAPENVPTAQSLLAPTAAVASNDVPLQSPGDLLGISPR